MIQRSRYIVAVVDLLRSLVKTVKMMIIQILIIMKNLK